VLKAGFVLVGNVPSADGTSAMVKAGSLLVLNRTGDIVAQWTPAMAKIDGPWDLTIFDQGNQAKVFVSNVLNGTVVRLDVAVSEDGVQIKGATQIASGYAFRGDPAALVVGPTGLAYDPQRDVLYVASTVDNAVFALFGAGNTKHDSGKGVLIYADNADLHGPLALALGPNGDLFTANGDAINADSKQPSEIVEFTTQGRFVAQLSVDPAQGGAFGLAFSQTRSDFMRFAAVDDNVPNITVWRLPFDDSGR
jgi:DNA-binding beta-propeller fold protein YncE